jgi:hypothetical protein
VDSSALFCGKQKTTKIASTNSKSKPMKLAVAPNQNLMNDDDQHPVAEQQSKNEAALAQAWEDSWMGQTVSQSMNDILKQ